MTAPDLEKIIGENIQGYKTEPFLYTHEEAVASIKQAIRESIPVILDCITDDAGMPNKEHIRNKEQELIKLLNL